MGTLAGLGLDLKPAKAAAVAMKSKLQGAREFASVCPYCAVGCGQIVSVRDGEIVNIEGNPDSPISRGRSAPRARPPTSSRSTRTGSPVKYRAPFATDWDEKPLDWAMGRIAELMKENRDASFRRPGRAGHRRQGGRQGRQPLPDHRLARRGDDGQRMELRPPEVVAGARA